MLLLDSFDTYNAGYVEELYERYLRSPGSVDESWRRYFGGGNGGGAYAVSGAQGAPPAPGTATAPAGAVAGALRRSGRRCGRC